MDLLFRPHSVERMMLRNIHPETVESIISDPDGQIPQSLDKVIFYKKIKGRKDNLIAIVAIQILKNQFEIITVMNNFEVQT